MGGGGGPATRRRGTIYVYLWKGVGFGVSSQVLSFSVVESFVKVLCRPQKPAERSFLNIFQNRHGFTQPGEDGTQKFWHFPGVAGFEICSLLC